MHYVYLMEAEDYKILKVGITSNITRRFRDLNKATPFKIRCVMFIRVKDKATAWKIEREIKTLLRDERAFPAVKDRKHKGYFNGITEWFLSNNFTRALVRVMFKEQTHSANVTSKTIKPESKIIQSYSNRQRAFDHWLEAET